MCRAGRSGETPPEPVTDEGLSLIEVLVSVVLLGLGGVAVLGGLGASLRGSAAHETKIEALAALESAAASLRHQVDPCTAEGYRSMAASGIADPRWSASLTVESLDCSTDLHQLRLAVTSEGGLTQTLDLAVGGPRVADVPGQGELDDADLPVVSCVVTNLTAVPPVIELTDSSLLSGDVRIEALTDTTCSGSLRAVFTPAPVDPATGLEWRPSFHEVGEQRYELILTEGTFAWEIGAVNTRVENRRPDDTFVDLGTVAGLVTTTCRADVGVNDESPARHPSGQLVDDLIVTVELSPACSASGSPTFEVNTGAGLYTGTFQASGSQWVAIVPGHDGDGPVFTSGAKSIHIDAAIAIAPVVVVIQ